jgi:hypothetical protein
MGLATAGNVVDPVKGGLTADQAPGAGKGQHSWFPVFRAMRSLAPGRTIPRTRRALFATIGLDVNHARLSVLVTESTLPSRDVVVL